MLPGITTLPNDVPFTSVTVTVCWLEPWLLTVIVAPGATVKGSRGPAESVIVTGGVAATAFGVASAALFPAAAFARLEVMFLSPCTNPLIIALTFCPAFGIALAIGREKRFKRRRATSTTTKKFTTLMIELPRFGAAMTFPFHANGAIGQGAVLRGPTWRSRLGKLRQGRSHFCTQSHHLRISGTPAHDAMGGEAMGRTAAGGHTAKDTVCVQNFT